MIWNLAFESLINYSSLPLNIIHMFLYFQPKKGCPFLVCLGVALMLIPLPVLPHLSGALTPDLKWAPLVMGYSFYATAVFRFLVFEGSFSRILFGVLSVGAFGHLLMVLIFAALFLGAAPRADYDSYTAARSVHLVLCLIIYPLLYRYARAPFVRILKAVDPEPWYVFNLAPLMLYLMSYLWMMIVFQFQNLLVTATGIMLAICLAGFYILLYNLIINRDLQNFLNSQLNIYRHLMNMYDHYDQEMAKKEESMRIMRHDFRHVLTRLDSLAREGDTGSIRRCIADLTEMSASVKIETYSGDRTVNTMISYFFNLARRNWVRCEARVDLPAALPLSEPEVAVLIGNTLENCVKAAFPLGQDGYILFQARPVKDRLVFKFENNYLDDDYTPGDGLGIRSIERERHGGAMEVNREGGRFRLTVILPRDRPRDSSPPDGQPALLPE